MACGVSERRGAGFATHVGGDCPAEKAASESPGAFVFVLTVELLDEAVDTDAAHGFGRVECVHEQSGEGDRAAGKCCGERRVATLSVPAVEPPRIEAEGAKMLGPLGDLEPRRRDVEKCGAVMRAGIGAVTGDLKGPAIVAMALHACCGFGGLTRKFPPDCATRAAEGEWISQADLPVIDTTLDVELASIKSSTRGRMLFRQDLPAKMP